MPESTPVPVELGAPAQAAKTPRLLRPTLVVASLTMLSRVLGLARDTAMAAFFGAGTPAMSAFAVAFRVPNLFRNLLGEGALSGAFIPVLAEHLEREDSAGARRLIHAVVTAQFVLMAALVAIGEAILLAWLAAAADPQLRLVLQLTAIMLPFLLMACLMAMLMAILNAHRRFALPAAAPLVLNVALIGFIVWLSPLFGDRPEQRIFAAAVAVVVAGLAQIAMHLPSLNRLGVRPQWLWDLAHPGLRRVIRSWLPMVLGLGVVQLNVLVDSLLAWNLDQPVAGGLLFGRFEYPMASGAPGVLYYAQRLYQLPLGVFAIALSTVVFVEFSRHAARDDREGLVGTLGRGLRLVLFICIPAAVALAVLGGPVVRLLLERGAFHGGDTARVSWTLLFYCLGLPAFAMQSMLVRAFYATGDTRTPVRTGMAMVGLNLPLNVLLIFLMRHEAGLAAATSFCGALQVAWLLWMLRRRLGRLGGRRVAAGAARTLAASAALGLACWAAHGLTVRFLPAGGLAGKLLAVLLPLAAGMAAFLAAAWLLRMSELRELRRGSTRPKRRGQTPFSQS